MTELTFATLMLFDNHLTIDMLEDEFGEDLGEHLWGKFERLGTLYFFNSLDKETFDRMVRLQIKCDRPT